MSELEAVIAEEKAKLVESKKLRMLYLDEEDMIEAGVMDAAKCVDVMEETMGLLEDGDFIMGGPEHNSHGIMLEFPKKPILTDSRLMTARTGGLSPCRRT